MAHYDTPFISRKELDLNSVRKKAEKILKLSKHKGEVTRVEHHWQTDTPTREWIEIYYDGTYNKKPLACVHTVEIKQWKKT